MKITIEINQENLEPKTQAEKAELMKLCADQVFEFAKGKRPQGVAPCNFSSDQKTAVMMLSADGARAVSGEF